MAIPRLALVAAVAVAVVSVAVAQPAALYVGGVFPTAGATPARNLAWWNGSDWAAVGAGDFRLGPGTVRALSTTTEAGGVRQLVTGGTFVAAGQAVANSIARFDGTLWAGYATGLVDEFNELGVADVYATLPWGEAPGSIIVGGYFTQAGGRDANSIAHWDGAAWQPLGAGVNGRVYALVAHAGGVYVGGDYLNAGGLLTADIARWDATNGWSKLGDGVANRTSAVYALAVLNGLLYVGGDFDEVSGLPATGVAVWDGTMWAAVGGGVGYERGIPAAVRALLVFQGQLVVAGRFNVAGNVSAVRIALWNDVTGTWSALGSGLDDEVRALALWGTGGSQLVAGGIFATAGGATANGLAVWDGTVWAGLGFAFQFDSAREVLTLLSTTAVLAPIEDEQGGGDDGGGDDNGGATVQAWVVAVVLAGVVVVNALVTFLIVRRYRSASGSSSDGAADERSPLSRGGLN
jgi:trimeric autotransporter adhesin